MVSILLLWIGLSTQTTRVLHWTLDGGWGVWDLQVGVVSPLLTWRARGEAERIEDLVWQTEQFSFHPFSFSALCVVLGLAFALIAVARVVRKRRPLLLPAPPHR